MTSPAERERVSATQTVFLLSPARTDGRRSQVVLNEAATSPLAVRLREQAASLGELFSFISGLYFRGKLTYARAFARHVSAPEGVLVIVPGLGLVPPEVIVSLADLRAIGAVGVSPDDPRFREPLERDTIALASHLSGGDRVVLLGSIATGKYVDVIDRHLGARLHFPVDFVGRGDMSRGGLMLRRVQEGRELDYVPVAGAVRQGPRPPRLEPIR